MCSLNGDGLDQRPRRCPWFAPGAHLAIILPPGVIRFGSGWLLLLGRGLPGVLRPELEQGPESPGFAGDRGTVPSEIWEKIVVAPSPSKIYNYYVYPD